MLKVLNLYAGIGGNRKLWNDMPVTAIENDKAIAIDVDVEQGIPDWCPLPDAPNYALHKALKEIDKH